jgi:hypoxanthine phosphoribosyltransferase
MDWNLFLTILFGIVGAAGVGTSIYYGKKSSSLEKSRVSMDFEDLTAASSDIADFLKGKNYKPDIIYTPGAKSAILAELISRNFTHEPIVIVGSLEWKNTGLTAIDIGKSKSVENNKWKIIIPEILISNADKNVLLVDDIAMSGDGLTKVVTILVDNGFKKENIKTSTLVCTSVAIASKKSPDFCWRQTDGTNYYFPWGKTR